ncbi:MAG: hypothetical protein JWO15_1418 [Sphingomonadales bacterium]|nr:hypothetical protein [Sphingomonadales bacterium]
MLETNLISDLRGKFSGKTSRGNCLAAEQAESAGSSFGFIPQPNFQSSKTERARAA